MNANVLPGHYIELTIVGIDGIDNIVWSIPSDSSFKSYDITKTADQFTPLGDTDKNKKIVKFFWSSEGTKTISVSFTHRGRQIPPPEATFNVGSVPVALNASLNPPQIGSFQYIVATDEFKLAGDISGGIVDPGIRAKATVSTPTGFKDGIWCFTQLIFSTTYLKKDPYDPFMCHFTAGTNVLDGTFVYNPEAPDGWSTKGSVERRWSDSPAIPAAKYFVRHLLKISCKTYIMFKPNDADTPIQGKSAWVALRSFKWSGAGCGIITTAYDITTGVVNWTVTTKPAPMAWASEYVQPQWKGDTSSLTKTSGRCPSKCGPAPELTSG